MLRKWQNFYRVSVKMRYEINYTNTAKVHLQISTGGKTAMNILKARFNLFLCVFAKTKVDRDKSK